MGRGSDLEGHVVKSLLANLAYVTSTIPLMVLPHVQEHIADTISPRAFILCLILLLYDECRWRPTDVEV